MTKAAKQTLANDIKLADNEEESVRAREREKESEGRSAEEDRRIEMCTFA